MCGWAKPDITFLTPRLGLFGYGGSATGPLGSIFQLSQGISNDGKIYFIGYGADTAGNKVIGDARWHHVGVTYDGTTVRMYADGELDSTGTNYAGKTGAIGDYNFEIGRQLYPDAGAFYNYRGNIREVMIYNRTLSNSEMKRIYQASVPESDLILNINSIKDLSPSKTIFARSGGVI